MFNHWACRPYISRGNRKRGEGPQESCHFPQLPSKANSILGQSDPQKSTEWTQWWHICLYQGQILHRWDGWGDAWQWKVWKWKCDCKEMTFPLSFVSISTKLNSNKKNLAISNLDKMMKFKDVKIWQLTKQCNCVLFE